jgi:hypothetical protein
MSENPDRILILTCEALQSGALISGESRCIAPSASSALHFALSISQFAALDWWSLLLTSKLLIPMQTISIFFIIARSESAILTSCGYKPVLIQYVFSFPSDMQDGG